MRNAASGRARRQPPLGLICLTLFLLLLPLTLSKPGLPVWLKADEAAFYLAALSLWHDGDMMCEDRDAERLFREYSGTDNLLLMSKARGQATYFSVPVTYPLLAAPFVGWFGANGMVLLNAALLMGMVWLGWAHLRRYNSDGLALLFAASFFLLSTAFVYIFWLQAEVLNMACVMIACYLAARVAEANSGAGLPARRWRCSVPRVRYAAGAGVALAIAIYSKPMLIVLSLPMLYALFRARSWRGLGAFAAAGLLTVALLATVAHRLTEQVWPYFAPRIGISLVSPVDYVERRVAPRMPVQARASAPLTRQVSQNVEQAWTTLPTMVLQSASEFLFGRHGGFVVYMPFAVVAVVFFLLAKRRGTFRWWILASGVLAAVLFLAMVRGQWLGGGGFVGNRYFTAVYPSFLFLVRSLRPSWLIAPAYAAAAVFLGPLLITPLGALVNHPTLQAHARNQPFPHLPLEWSLARKIAGYRQWPVPGAQLYGRPDEIEQRGDELWVRGAKRVGMDLLSTDAERGFVIDVRNLAPNNTVEICVQRDCRRLEFDDVPVRGSKQRLTLDPQPGVAIPRSAWGGEVYRYALRITSEWGEQPRWRGSSKDGFYLGAALAFLGSPEELARELRKVTWLSVEAPPTLPAGATVGVPVVLRNASEHGWLNLGPTRVKLSYHWLSADGRLVTWAGRRTELPSPLAAGEQLAAQVVIDTPADVGSYELALDLIRERVGWFSALDIAQAYRIPVEVVAPPAAGKP
ncbi:MAG: hypothetical protein AAF560_31940 [Acidobacteriota bacterium]